MVKAACACLFEQVQDALRLAENRHLELQQVELQLEQLKRQYDELLREKEELAEHQQSLPMHTVEEPFPVNHDQLHAVLAENERLKEQVFAIHPCSQPLFTGG
jgi:hypothetical protein